MSPLPTTTALDAGPLPRSSSRQSWIAICLFLLAGVTLWPRLADLAGQATPQAIAAAPASSALPTKAIQEIKPDDWVLARAEHGSQVTWKPVKEVYRRRADHLRIVTFRDATDQLQTLQTTDDHPFWSEQEREFLPAEELAVGDAVTGADGSTLILVSTRREDHPLGIDVYNFQVADFHTYFAAESDHSTPILVHNSNCQKIGPFGVPGSGPIHHLVSIYKNLQRRFTRPWVLYSQQILQKAGIRLEDGTNKVYLPGHAGQHSELYHEKSFRSLNAAVKNKRAGTKAYAEAVRDELESIANDLLTSPQKLTGVSL